MLATERRAASRMGIRGVSLVLSPNVHINRQADSYEVAHWNRVIFSDVCSPHGGSFLCSSKGGGHQKVTSAMRPIDPDDCGVSLRIPIEIHGARC